MQQEIRVGDRWQSKFRIVEVLAVYVYDIVEIHFRNIINREEAAVPTEDFRAEFTHRVGKPE